MIMSQTQTKRPATAPTPPVFELIEVEQEFSVPKPGRSLLSRDTVGLKALDGVRLSIAQGASLALVGESGSGKSTLLRVLLGLDAPSGGRALAAPDSPATWRWSIRTRAARSTRA